MRAVKVFTGVWLFCMMVAVTIYLVDPDIIQEGWYTRGGLLFPLILLPVFLIALLGISLVPILWVVALMLWLTRPGVSIWAPWGVVDDARSVPRAFAKQDPTPPADKKALKDSARRYDAGHRWLG